MQACKKNDDSVPQIIMSSPVANEEFIAGDTLLVKASITHSSVIVSVKVALVNTEGVPVLTPKYFFPATNSYEVNYEYLVESDLPGGNYSLLLSVADEKSTEKLYTPVAIRGQERVFNRVIAVCKPNTLKTYLYTINKVGEQNLILSLDCRCTDADISNDLRLLYILRKSPDILIALDLDSLWTEYSIDAMPPYPEFNSVSFFSFPSLAYVPNANGEIRGYNGSGTPVYVTAVNLDTIPLRCWKHDNIILAYCERRGGPERFIRQYYCNTGVFRLGMEMDLDIIGIFSPDPDISIVFGNDENGRVLEYDVRANFIYSEISIPEGTIGSIVSLTAGKCLFSHVDGIFIYDYDGGSVIPWLTGIEADAIAYDSVREYVYVATGNLIQVYRLSDEELLQEVTLPYEVEKILIQYNF